MADIDTPDGYARVMGMAAIAVWGDLPRDIQENLFEHAVQLGYHMEQDEGLRERLGRFLHDRRQKVQAQ
jgi:hypothetical protein